LQASDKPQRDPVEPQTRFGRLDEAGLDRRDLDGDGLSGDRQIGVGRVSVRLFQIAEKRLATSAIAARSGLPTRSTPLYPYFQRASVYPRQDCSRFARNRGHPPVAPR